MFLLVLAIICFWFAFKKDSSKDINEFELGVRYLKGTDVPQDYEQAFIHFHKAANLGLREAQFNVGLLYYRGLGVSQDYKRATEWLKSSADQDYLPAQSELGAMMCDGLGIAKNEEKGLSMILRAAAKGDETGKQYVEYYHDLMDKLIKKSSTVNNNVNVSTTDYYEDDDYNVPEEEPRFRYTGAPFL